MTPYLHKYDPDVSPDEYAEIVDRWHDERPTRADVDDRPEPVVPKVVVEPCEGCAHLMCCLQRRVGRSA